MKMPNPSQECPVSSKALNKDLKDIDLLCTFKIKMESKNQNMGVSRTSDSIQIKIKMTNPSQEPPPSSKAPPQDLCDMGVLCTFKIKMESKNSKHGCINDQ